MAVEDITKFTQFESYLLHMYCMYIGAFGLLSLRFALSNSVNGKIYLCQINTLRAIASIYLLEQFRSFLVPDFYKTSILISVAFFICHLYFGYFYSEDTFWTADEYEQRISKLKNE